jgi:hypothetical protein
VAQADGRAVRGIRQDGQAGPSWPCGCPPRSTRPTSHRRRHSGRGTPGHRHGTPDVHTRTLDTERVDIACADTGRSHRTPDTGRVDTTDYADRAPRHAGIRTDILDHHDQRTARWDAEPWTCGRRLRRSAMMTARRGWGICQRETTYRATRRLLGRSVGQAAPRRTALLRRFRVEGRARGARSSVMARACAGCWRSGE